jgi:hypothetical protein
MREAAWKVSFAVVASRLGIVQVTSAPLTLAVPIEADGAWVRPVRRLHRWRRVGIRRGPSTVGAVEVGDRPGRDADRPAFDMRGVRGGRCSRDVGRRDVVVAIAREEGSEVTRADVNRWAQSEHLG